MSFSNKAVDRNFYLLNEFDKKKNVKENYFFLHVTLMFPFTFPLLFVIFWCVFLFFYGEQNEAKFFLRNFLCQRLSSVSHFITLFLCPGPHPLCITPMHQGQVWQTRVRELADQSFNTVACRRLRTILTSKHRLFSLDLVLFPMHPNVSLSSSPTAPLLSKCLQWVLGFVLYLN